VYNEMIDKIEIGEKYVSNLPHQTKSSIQQYVSDLCKQLFLQHSNLFSLPLEVHPRKVVLRHLDLRIFTADTSNVTSITEVRSASAGVAGMWLPW